MSDENKKYVPEGVFLVCDMGAIPSQLIATPRKVNLYGPMIGTDADNKFTVNVLPFGACKTLGAPCAFACVQWTKTKSGNVFVNGEKPLLEDSEAICTVGAGKIKIFFDKYEADLANENNNESGFVSEDISSNILGQVLTWPFGNIVDLFSDDDDKFTEGVGRGFKKGMESTWNFLTDDMWKGDTWKGLGKMAVIGAAYSGPTGMLMGETNLRVLDETFGSDLVSTKDALVEGVSNTASNAWEDVKRGEMGEVGESVGQIQYAVVEAVVGTKGAGVVVKGLSTGAKALIGVERLAQLTAKISKFANALKQGVLSVVKVGRKIVKIGPELPKRHIVNFTDEIAVARQVNGSETFYKYHGSSNRLGRDFNYVTKRKYSSLSELKEDLALLDEWGVKVEYVTEFKPQRGTWIHEGTAARQISSDGKQVLNGGGYQGTINVKDLPNRTIIKTDKVKF